MHVHMVPSPASGVRFALLVVIAIALLLTFALLPVAFGHRGVSGLWAFGIHAFLELGCFLTARTFVAWFRICQSGYAAGGARIAGGRWLVFFATFMYGLLTT